MPKVGGILCPPNPFARRTMSNPQDSDFVEHLSAVAFAPTLERLDRAIEAAGMTIFSRIDHAAGAREAGLDMPPTVVLVYGNPRGGTPIMLSTPQAALDLPLRVLVRERDDGRALVPVHPVAPMRLIVDGARRN